MANVPKKVLNKGKRWFNSAIEEALNNINLRLDRLEQSNSILVEKSYASGAIVTADREIVTKIFTGLKCYLDPNDLSVTPHLALDGIWEADITRAWLSVIKEDSIVLDIGANFGYFGLIAAQKLVDKNSKVVFFEANPKLIPYIQKTLAVNFFSERSIISNVAVSDRKGTLSLNVLKDYIGSSSIHTVEHLKEYLQDKMHLEAEEVIKVDATTIDDFCSEKKIRKVNLIKMDIEGYEEKAYQGMLKTIKNNSDIILFIEFTKGSYENPESFYDQMLKDFGSVYTIGAGGKLNVPQKNDYKTVVDDSEIWTMLVFSKKKLVLGKE